MASRDHAPTTGIALEGGCDLCGEPIPAEDVSVAAFEITGALACTHCLEALAEQGVAE